jgi:hypothetical protein
MKIKLLFAALRCALICWLVYLAYTETGIYTIIALIIMFVYLELNSLAAYFQSETISSITQTIAVLTDILKRKEEKKNIYH